MTTCYQEESGSPSCSTQSAISCILAAGEVREGERVKKCSFVAYNNCCGQNESPFLLFLKRKGKCSKHPKSPRLTKEALTWAFPSEMNHRNWKPDVIIQ